MGSPRSPSTHAAHATGPMAPTLWVWHGMPNHTSAAGQCCCPPACLPALPAAGLMKMPSCKTADLWPILSNASEITGLRIFSVKWSTTTLPMGVPLALTNLGRIKGSCAEHLSLGGAASCSDSVPQLAGPSSPGARQWVFEDAGKSADGGRLVRIYSAVSRAGVGGWGGLALLPLSDMAAAAGARTPPAGVLVFAILGSCLP